MDDVKDDPVPGVSEGAHRLALRGQKANALFYTYRLAFEAIAVVALQYGPFT